MNTLSWFALRARARQERLTADLLKEKGYAPFLPTYLVKRRWSDRTKVFEQPLFPGYLFCQFDPSNSFPIVTTPTVMSIVGAGRTPLRVPDEEIETVRKVVASGLAAMPWPYIKPGEAVYLTDGPLTGLEGTVVSVRNECRLVVSVNMLQRSVAVEIDREWVRPTVSRKPSVSAAGFPRAYIG